MKIYTLYPTGGSFSNNTIDYQGEILDIAAVSNKQAHYFAHKGIWAKDPDNPAGIVLRYKRDVGHRLWDGCEDFAGLDIHHGSGKRAITAAMKAHLETDHP